MNYLLIAGWAILIFALIFYSISIIVEQKTKKISMLVVFFATMGVLFDASSSLLMMMGSPESIVTTFSILGYLGVVIMAINVFMVWVRFRNKRLQPQPEAPWITYHYSRYAYIIWLVIFAVRAFMTAYIYA